MFDYFIKVILFQILFLAIYDLLLKRETFFQWNRFYLLLTSLLSFVIPLVRIDRVQEVIPVEYVVALPEVVLSPSTVIENNSTEPAQIFDYLTALYWVGAVVMALFFIVKLAKLIRLIQTGEKRKINQFFLVGLQGNAAFSFFNYIFLGKAISEERRQQIISHELIHMHQKHSLDLLFFELQKICCWFNPMSYVFQMRMTEVHEYIADAQSVKSADRKVYFTRLLSETFGVAHIAFINPFFKRSLIKKRIMMLSKNQSKQVLKFKYLLLVPLLGGMLLYSSCDKELTKKSSLVTKNEKRMVKLYMKSPNPDDEVKIIETSKEGYFDFYLFGAVPEGKKIFYEDLNDEERAAYDDIIKKRKDVNNNFFESHTIFELPDGRKAVKENIDWKAMKANRDSKDYSDADNVPFAVIDEAPVYPGCEDAADKKLCLQENIQKFVNRKFNTALANELKLEPGRNRIYVQFEITKEGNISYVRARGPHEKLEEEAVNVIYDLPQMQPGEHNGKKVGVKYTLPITLMVAGETPPNQVHSDTLPYSRPRPVGNISKFVASIPEGFIRGQVKSLTKSLPGTNIRVEGSDSKAISDFNGNFEIEASQGDMLLFQFKEATSRVKVDQGNNYYQVFLKL